MSNLTFEEWKDEINKIVNYTIKRNLDELPDMCYREWYNNNNLNVEEISFIILGEYYKIKDKQLEFCKSLLEKSEQCLV